MAIERVAAGICSLALLCACGGTSVDKTRSSGGSGGASGSGGVFSLGSGGSSGGGVVFETGGARGSGAMTGVGGGLSGQSCDLTKDSVTIDIQPKVLPVDGGRGESASVELDGRITRVIPKQFEIDTCAPNAECAPTLRMVIIDSPWLDLTRALRADALAHVQYELSCGWGCSSDIIVTSLPAWGGLTNPAPPGSGIYVAANDGGQLITNAPFEVSEVKLACPSAFMDGCGDPGSAGLYAFEFRFPNTPAEVVPMGFTKTIALAAGSGVDVRNLRSFVTGYCDDYWNWAYWVAARRLPLP